MNPLFDLGGKTAIVAGAASGSTTAEVVDGTGSAPSRSESLGHQELVPTYKSFAPIGPDCLPAVRGR